MVDAGQAAVGDVGGGVEQYKIGIYRRLIAFMLVDHYAFGRGMVDCLYRRACADLDAQRPRPAGERVNQRAHAAHRHAPFARALADDVVEEAAVLKQGGVVWVGWQADFCVSEYGSTDQVIRQVRLDHLAQRLLEHGVPGGALFAGREFAAQGFFGGQRLEQGRPHAPGNAI